MIEADYSNACIGAQFASQEVSMLVFSIRENVLICYKLIEEQVVLLDHLDDELVVAANVGNVLWSGASRTEDVWPDGDCHVVRGHLVIWLMLDYHSKHVDVELQRVKMDLRKLVYPVLEL